MQVFGSEAGKYLFRTVQEDIEAEWHGSLMGVLVYCMLNCLFLPLEGRVDDDIDSLI